MKEFEIHNLFKRYNPIIIFEGFDRVGKSSAISRLRAVTGATSIHPSPFSKLDDNISVLEEYKRVWKMATMKKNRGIILDRFIGTEFAYGNYGHRMMSEIGINKQWELHNQTLFTYDDWRAVLTKIATYPYILLFLMECSYPIYLDRETGHSRSEDFFWTVNRKYHEFVGLFHDTAKRHNKFSQFVHVIESKENDEGIRDYNKIFKIIFDELARLRQNGKKGEEIEC